MCCSQLIKLLNAGDFAPCFAHSNVAKENSREFRINSNKKICRVKNDGCLNKSESERKCDYFFKLCDTKEIILVELKGTDVEEAVTQITATHKKLSLSLSKEYSFNAFIISSSIPAAAEFRFRKLRDKCLRDLSLSIEKRHFKGEINR